MPQCKFGAATHIGLVRTQNEDAILTSEDLGLWLVADGMGGHQGGEIASACARDAIAAAIAAGASLPDAILSAHHAILDAVETGHGKPGMGSTVVAMLALEHQFQIAWVGDSRAYLWQKSANARLQRLTKDHSYVQSLVDSGLILPEETFGHPDRNVITQCLGSPGAQAIKVDCIERKWRVQDRILLCSDGLTDDVHDDTLAEVLDRHEDPTTTAEVLQQLALNQGGKDNVSVIVVDAPQDAGDGWRNAVRDFFDRG